MAKVNKSRLLDLIVGRTTIYLPIVEAVVNAIDAVEERGASDGTVEIRLMRNPVLVTTEDDESSPVTSVIVTDNGIGFTDKNRESFDTLFSENKVRFGGKGFGRLTYLKYFDVTNITSNYQDTEGKWKKRTFGFLDGEEFLSNEVVDDLEKGEYLTVVSLKNIRKAHANKLNKKLSTIARRLYEILLPYFVMDGYTPPLITIVDDSTNEKIVLNDYLKSQDKISLLYSEDIEIENFGETKSFKVKVVKIFHSTAKSSVALAANHRQVVTTPLYNYVPEFFEDFKDQSPDDKGNYVLKAYVMGDYLDENVSVERSQFNFADDDETQLYPVSRNHIGDDVAKMLRTKMKTELKPRSDRKLEKVQEYVDESAPWNRHLLGELDLDTLPFNASNKEIDTALNKIAFDKEQTVKVEVAALLKDNNANEIDTNIAAIAEKVTALGQGNLAHYVELRRVILNIFKKSLQLKSTNRYELENIVHSIVFPLRKDSDSINYDEHNLWLLDERLSFSEYVASDKPLNVGDERPDLLSFDRPIAVREGDELSNPITIFEFKRPGRNDYSDTDNPLTQVTKYVQKIRSGNFKNPQGRFVRANEHTPAYCFIVCDVTEKIREFCKLYQLTMSPDGDAYYGFHSTYQIYFEVMSFDKVVRDSEQRNKVFFRKLGIE